MAYRLGQPLEYDPWDQPEEDIIDSPAAYSLGEAVSDPFEGDPFSSDLDEPDEEGHSLWDIPRVMGKGAAGVGKTAAMVFSLLNPAEMGARVTGLVGDLTGDEFMQAYSDYSREHSVSAKIEEYGETAEKYYDEKLTPAMKKSMSKTILASGEEEGFFGEGITDPWKIGGLVAESIPSTLISMGAGGLITKGLIQTGMKAAPKIVQNVLNRMVTKYGINSVAGVVGGAVGEGGYSGLDNANQAYEEMMDTPQEKLAQSKTYREIWNSLPDRFTDEQKHEYSRKILSLATAGFIGTTTAVTTGILGAPSGAFMGKLIGGEAGKSFWGNLLKGAITEGLFEEAPQSGIERLVTNMTKRLLVDPNQALTEGMGEAMASGAIAGFAMGGGMAAVAGAEGQRHPVMQAKDLLTGGKKKTKAKDILTGDETPPIPTHEPPPPPIPEFEGDESIDAEEEAGEHPDEDLDAQIPPPIPPKEVPSDDKKGRKEPIPGEKPRGQEPIPPPKPPPGKEAPPTGGILQTPIPDEDVPKVSPRQHRQNIINKVGERAGVKLRYDFTTTDEAGKQLHQVTVMSGEGKGTAFPISSDMKMPDVLKRIKALGAIPKTERRKEPERPAWDDHFRAVMGEAKKQDETAWTETAATRAAAGDPAILDLARRMGQTIEPDTDLSDVLKTVHARINAGMEPAKRVQEMTEPELKTAIMTDYLTGLKSKHAFEVEDERKKHVASIDLDSLKYFNDNFGHQTGDEMLINFGSALKQIDSSDTYHISGDEYIVQSNDPNELKRLLDEDLVKALKKFPIRVTLPDGKKIEVEVQFSYGTGQTITESEEALHAHKDLREASGQRAGRGEVPRSILENLAEGKRPGDKREKVPEEGIAPAGRKAPVRTVPSSEEAARDLKKELDAAAAEVDTDPSQGQKEAGNYKKGHLYDFLGFDITLENPKGSTREGIDKGGQKWSQEMRHHYGYFKRTEGKDGDQIDVFIGDNLDSSRAFVVDQVDPETGKFDEHKVLIGFPSEKAARLGYLASYEKNWGGLGAITEMSLDELKDWIGPEGKRVTKPVGELPSPEPSREPGIDEEGEIKDLEDYEIGPDDPAEDILRALRLHGDWPQHPGNAGGRHASAIDQIKERGLENVMMELGWPGDLDHKYTNTRGETKTLAEVLEFQKDSLHMVIKQWEPVTATFPIDRLNALDKIEKKFPKRIKIYFDHHFMPTLKKAERSFEKKIAQARAWLEGLAGIAPEEEASPVETLKKDLEFKGAGRIGDVTFKILPTDYGGFYFQTIENGKRTDHGPGYPANDTEHAWTIEQAITAALEYAAVDRPSPEKAREDPRVIAAGAITGGKRDQLERKFDIGYADEIGALEKGTDLYYDVVGVLGGHGAEQFVKAGLSVTRAPSPEVAEFSSGASRTSDIEAHTAAGLDIGVVAGEVSAAGLIKLAVHAQAGNKVYMDSGAFTAFTRGKPINWAKVFSKYEKLVNLTGKAAAGNLYLMAPDMIGNQEKTLDLVREFSDRTKILMIEGANVFVAIQKGNDVPSLTIKRLQSILGKAIIPAVPSNKKAFSGSDLQDLLTEVDTFPGIHFLGMSKRNKKYPEFMKQIRRLAPRLPITVDASTTIKGISSSADYQKKMADLGAGGPYAEVTAGTDEYGVVDDVEDRHLRRAFQLKGREVDESMITFIKEGGLEKAVTESMGSGEELDYFAQQAYDIYRYALRLQEAAKAKRKEKMEDHLKGEKPLAALEDIEAKKGKETKVITPGNPRGYGSYYALVEADDIIPSHNAQTFQKNPGYPEGIQERTYHSDPREQEKVVKNAQHLAPSIVLSDDPTPTNGPPIITKEGIVLGGNSRAMSLQRAYKSKIGPRYKDGLATKASLFSLRPKDVQAMEKPVLVRVVYLEADNVKALHRMATEFNESLTQGMSQEAEIASMGKNISVETVEKVGLRMANRDLSLRELLGKKDGAEILQWLIADNAISKTDENRFINKKIGLLNDAGKQTIEKAFFGSIIDDADLISSAPKSLLNKVGRALPSLARIKARGEKWDITPQVKNALELATAAKAADLSIKEHQAQGSLFGDKKEYTDIETVLANLMLKDSMTAFSKRFKNFAADAMADAKNQTFLFPPKEFTVAFKDAFDAQVKEPAPPPLEPEKTTGELVQMSFDNFLEYMTDRSRKTGEKTGITFTEEVEVEETGDQVERERDAIAFLNEIDDNIDGWQQLVNCLKATK